LRVVAREVARVVVARVVQRAVTKSRQRAARVLPRVVQGGYGISALRDYSVGKCEVRGVGKLVARIERGELEGSVML
jgi:hypothetical protein